MSLFGSGGDEPTIDEHPVTDVEFDKAERLSHEKEMLGLYVSDHPLMGYEQVLARRTDGPLDVYKRQLQDIFGRDNLFVEIQDHGIPEQHRTNPQPVSYTHLDVYKRQNQPGSLERQQDLLEIGLGEPGPLDDVAHRRWTIDLEMCIRDSRYGDPWPLRSMISATTRNPILPR